MNKVLFKWFLYIFLGLIGIFNWEYICLYTDYRFLRGHIAQAREITSKYIIKIPEINLISPIVFAENADMKKALEKGVLHYPGSALPGEDGVITFLGHSAPHNWPKNDNYYWVFSELNNLKKGDHFSLYFNQDQYFYKVVSKYFLNKGQETPVFENKKQTLILISCWPPGKNSERIVIEATLR